MKKKTLAMLLCAVMIVTSAAFGTIAYLTDRDSVVNTFTVGNVEITVDETKVNTEGDPVDEDGNVIDPNDPNAKDPARVTGNTYHLLPGETYTKDPTMTVVKGSEESYVRMIVTIVNIDKVREALGQDFLPQNFVEGWNPEVWVTTGVINEITDEETSVQSAEYEFRYYQTVNAKDATENIVLAPLFTSFTVPGETTNAELAKLADMKILVEGHAIQVKGFEESADAAWAAFDAQYTTTEDSVNDQNTTGENSENNQNAETEDTATNP